MQFPQTGEILAAREARNDVDPWRPYAFLAEEESNAAGQVELVHTIFLTNRECPFRCLMCDLWQNTTTETVPVGAIPAQIDFAVGQLPPARHIKLYNSGNFFDPRAIPPDDYDDILHRIGDYQTVIVENHPRFCGPPCFEFAQNLPGDLEVAIGLETIHPDVLPALNKQMTCDDFQRAVSRLRAAGIHTRAFILLRPPFLGEQEGVDWALRSLEFAFDCGVRCCAVIPTRDGNGIMEQLRAQGQFEPPTIGSLESVLAAGLSLERGRVFVDLWDAERFASCAQCSQPRIERLRRMNLLQTTLPPIECDAC